MSRTTPGQSEFLDGFWMESAAICDFWFWQLKIKIKIKIKKEKPEKCLERPAGHSGSFGWLSGGCKSGLRSHFVSCRGRQPEREVASVWSLNGSLKVPLVTGSSHYISL